MKQLHMELKLNLSYFNFIELKIVNVNPLSLGIITNGGLMCTFIPKNSILPIKKTKKFKNI